MLAFGAVVLAMLAFMFAPNAFLGIVFAALVLAFFGWVHQQEEKNRR